MGFSARRREGEAYGFGNIGGSAEAEQSKPRKKRILYLRNCFFSETASNYALEWFSGTGSAPIRSAVKFYFDIDVRIFFQLLQKIFFSIDQKKSLKIFEKVKIFKIFKKSKIFKDKK